METGQTIAMAEHAIATVPRSNAIDLTGAQDAFSVLLIHGSEVNADSKAAL
jgi:hypothetical protein